MDAPTPTATRIAETTNKNPVANSKWSDYNGRNDYAELEFVATATVDDLPPKILAAITAAGLSKSRLETQEVNWTIRCMSHDGRSALSSTSKVYGGDKSSKVGCGEVGMWFNEASNVKDAARPQASAEFEYQSAIYVINAGLCPCKRCAFGLMNLARATKSIIIVSPQTDYDYLDATASRVDVSGDAVYFHVYDSAQAKVQVYSSRTKPAHLDEAVAEPPALALFTCEKSHVMRVLFADGPAMMLALKPPTGKAARTSEGVGPVFKCPTCLGRKVALRYTPDAKPGLKPLKEHAVGTLTPF